MTWSGTTWLWLAGLLTVLIQGSQAGEFCYTDDYFDYNYEWCEHGCCGSYGDKYCCDVNIAGIVVGVIIAAIVIGVVITLVICCCVSSCPLHRRRSYRGRVLGQGQVVTTTTTPAVIGGQTQTTYVTTPGQPGVFAQPPPQAQPAPYLQQYPPPQAAVAPPPYSAAQGAPSPQYPPSVATQPPPPYPPSVATEPTVQSSPPSAPPSNVYEKLNY